MVHVIDAVFENGVLRPLSALDLPEHQVVRVTVETVKPPEDATTPKRDPLEGLRVATGIRDLADHLDDYRFGRRQA